MLKAFLKKFLPGIFLRKFFEVRYNKIKSKPLDITNNKIKKIVKELDSKGIFVIKKYADLKKVKEIKKKLAPFLKKLDQGQQIEGFTCMYLKDEPHIRIMNVDKLVPESIFFFHDTFIKTIFQSYGPANLVSHQFMVDKRRGVGLTTNNDDWHFDDPFPVSKCKAFLYLDEVTKLNGPFCFIPGTHKKGPWRTWKDTDAITRGYDGDWGFYTLNNVDYIKKKHGFEEIIVTGSPGDLILFDAGGLHKSSVLQSGTRTILSTYFEIPNWKKTVI